MLGSHSLAVNLIQGETTTFNYGGFIFFLKLSWKGKKFDVPSQQNLPLSAQIKLYQIKKIQLLKTWTPVTSGLAVEVVDTISVNSCPSASAKWSHMIISEYAESFLNADSEEDHLWAVISPKKRTWPD